MVLRKLVRWVVMVAVSTGTVGGAVLPALAGLDDHQDGPDHSFGEMVDYSLAFPVPGVEWYEDWFWVPRSDGLHHAQDLFAPKGTEVRAIADGVVVWGNGSGTSVWERPDKCCQIAILHDDGWRSAYVHLDNDSPGTDDGQAWGLAPGLDIGTRVTAGEVIGWVGDSGNAENTAPHLHFELKDPDGTLVNPYDALRAAQGSPVCSVADPGQLGDLISSSGLLREGDSGAAVAQLQRLTQAFGHDPGPIDGVFGPRTEAAVRLLQADLEVAADGIVGDETRAAVTGISEVLGHAPALDPDGRLMFVGVIGADVADLQALLALAGYDPGATDGSFGSRTRSAVVGLQRDAGISADGIVGRMTWTALGDAVGVARLVTCGS